jgi:hypothetical protein
MKPKVRAREFAAEDVRRHIQAVGLPADQRVIELDLDFDAEPAQIRPQLAVTTVLADANGFEHLDAAPRRLLGGQPDLVDRRDERRGAAVHDRHLGAVDLDDRIVDAKAAQSGQHVFGGRYCGAVMVAQHGGEFRRRYRAIMGFEFAIGFAGRAAAQEDDAGIAFSGMQRQGNRRAGMDTDPRNRHLLTQGCLPAAVRAGGHTLIPHPLAQSRERDCSRPLHQGNAGVCGIRESPHGTAETPPPHIIPSALRLYRRSGLGPTHAFLPSVTIFRPHSCQQRAANAASPTDFCERRRTRPPHRSRREWFGADEGLGEKSNISAI